MDGAIQSFLSGIPFLLTHFGVTIVMLVVGAFIYIKITSHDEMALIRDGNNAAAVSLSGAILGLAIPLAFCMANSVNVYDIVIWGLVTLVIQLVTFLDYRPMASRFITKNRRRSGWDSHFASLC